MGVVQLGVSGHSFFLLMFAPPPFFCRLQSLGREVELMREESVRLRAQSERLRSERSSLQQKLQEMETSLFDSRDEFRRLNEVLKVEREQWSMEHISSKLLTSELTREVDMLRQSSKQQQQQEQSYRSETKLEPIRSSSIGEELSASETRIQDMEDEIKALKQENNGWLNNFFFFIAEFLISFYFSRSFAGGQ